MRPWVHELGHVGASIMTGRFVTGIRLRFDHSGTTVIYGKLGGAREIVEAGALY